jgi:HAD superfamily hydrolase (TIGR01509 family)
MHLVIFDCDGTLVESEWLGHRAMEEELQKLGIHETAESLTERYRGFKLAEALADLSGIHKVSFDEEFVARYRTRVHHLFSTHLRPVPGIEKLLSRLRIPFCVASSGPMEKIRHSLAVAGLLSYFEGRIFSSYDIQSWKPDPGLFLHAARMMGVPHANCLVVEDSAVGIEAAKFAGMTAILYDPGRIYPSSRADHVVTHMSELAEFFEKL